VLTMREESEPPAWFVLGAVLSMVFVAWGVPMIFKHCLPKGPAVTHQTLETRYEKKASPAPSDAASASGDTHGPVIVQRP